MSKERMELGMANSGKLLLTVVTVPLKSQSSVHLVAVKATDDLCLRLIIYQNIDRSVKISLRI